MVLDVDFSLRREIRHRAIPWDSPYRFFNRSIRLTRFLSALLTGMSFCNSRFARLLFLRRKWVARPFLLLSLPLPVTLNLLAVVL